MTTVETFPLIDTFFDDYAKALASYSPEKIASYYATPFAVYSDRGSRAVNDIEDVVAFWEQGVKPYKEENIVRAHPTILGEEQLSKTMWTCKVRWTNYDASGDVVASETNFYMLSNHGDAVKIVGLILMTL